MNYYKYITKEIIVSNNRPFPQPCPTGFYLKLIKPPLAGKAEAQHQLQKLWKIRDSVAVKTRYRDRYGVEVEVEPLGRRERGVYCYWCRYKVSGNDNIQGEGGKVGKVVEANNVNGHHHHLQHDNKKQRQQEFGSGKVDLCLGQEGKKKNHCFPLRCLLVLMLLYVLPPYSRSVMEFHHG